LVICFSIWWQKPALSSLLQRAASLWRYFITRFQRSASFCGHV
jgi:hypothetical protein